GFLVLGAVAGHVHLVLGLGGVEAAAGPLARGHGGVQLRLGSGAWIELVDALVLLHRLLVVAFGPFHLALGLPFLLLAVAGEHALHAGLGRLGRRLRRGDLLVARAVFRLPPLLAQRRHLGLLLRDLLLHLRRLERHQ